MSALAFFDFRVLPLLSVEPKEALLSDDFLNLLGLIIL